MARTPQPLPVTSVAPDHVATMSALQYAGFSVNSISRRCRVGGPWRRVLPGVVQLGTEPLTRRQQLSAAVAHAGPDAVITGADALAAWGVDVRLPPQVRLLVSATRRLASRELVAIERTSRLPKPLIKDGLPVVPPARAALDVARNAGDLVELRSVVALTWLHGLATRADLELELAAGNQRGTAEVRAALRELPGLAAAILHARAERLLREAPLPAPLWDVTIVDSRRRAIGHADAWWDHCGLAWQLSQAPHHFEPPHGHLSLTAAGAVVVRTPVATVLRAGAVPEIRESVIAEVVTAFHQAASGRRPPLSAQWYQAPDAA